MPSPSSLPKLSHPPSTRDPGDGSRVGTQDGPRRGERARPPALGPRRGAHGEPAPRAHHPSGSSRCPHWGPRSAASGVAARPGWHRPVPAPYPPHGAAGPGPGRLGGRRRAAAAGGLRAGRRRLGGQRALRPRCAGPPLSAPAERRRPPISTAAAARRPQGCEAGGQPSRRRRGMPPRARSRRRGA